MINSNSIGIHFLNLLLNPSIGVSFFSRASGVRLGTCDEPSDDSQFMMVSTVTISPPRAELKVQSSLYCTYFLLYNAGVS